MKDGHAPDTLLLKFGLDMKTDTTQKDARTPQQVSLKAGVIPCSDAHREFTRFDIPRAGYSGGRRSIVCEDTRVTGKLMKAFGLKKPMRVYNDHATEKTATTSSR